MLTARAMCWLAQGLPLATQAAKSEPLEGMRSPEVPSSGPCMQLATLRVPVQAPKDQCKDATTAGPCTSARSWRPLVSVLACRHYLPLHNMLPYKMHVLAAERRRLL